MQPTDDMGLLREYASGHAEEAFATLVTRHIDLVYSAALRHVGNHHQAEEITQAVFVILARKARSLGPGTVLAGWLFRTARLTAANYLRTEIRRARREQEAFMQSKPTENSGDPWQEVAPLLNDAIAALAEGDRNAIVLRFLQGKLLAAGAVLIGWELQQSARQGRELASVRAASEAQQRELDARQAELDELSAKNQQLQETETRAGNQTLLALMRERAAATQAATESAPPNRGVGAALARVLDNQEQRDAEREHLANKIRADMGTFFRLANLSPEKVDQFVAFSVEAEQRKAARLSALLHGTLSVADAIRERDNDEVEFEKKRHEVLGDSGYEFLNGIADGMRNDEARRLLKLIQQNMGDNALTQEQSDRLQPLIKSEIVSINTDDVELFRPPDEWARQYLQRQENALQAASGFLTPAQIETLRTIAAYDLADRQKRMAAQRQSLGIN